MSHTARGAARHIACRGVTGAGVVLRMRQSACERYIETSARRNRVHERIAARYPPWRYTREGCADTYDAAARRTTPSSCLMAIELLFYADVIMRFVSCRLCYAAAFSK